MVKNINHQTKPAMNLVVAGGRRMQNFAAMAASLRAQCVREMHNLQQKTAQP